MLLSVCPYIYIPLLELRGTYLAHAHTDTYTLYTALSKEINYAEDRQDAPKTQQELDMNSRMRKESE